MGQGLWTHPWVRHSAVAIGYGLAVVLFRELSYSQWMILAGLRLSVLLLVPYRYWPALAVGEFGYFLYQAIDCLPNWGPTWSVCAAVPVMVLIAPFIYVMRERWNPFQDGAVHIARLLTGALIISLVETLRSLSLFLVMKHLPAGYVIDYPAFGADYFIGDYLGVLTITPLAVFVCRMLGRGGWHQLGKKIASSHVLYESVCLGVPLLAFLVWIGMASPLHSQTRQFAQIAMFLPVVWLALRHGWGGAAVGGAAASCAVMMLMPADHDYDTFRAEFIVAFAISTMLLMGERIAALDRGVRQEREDFRAALAIAQRNVYVGEMQLRVTSQALEQIRENVQLGFTSMMGRLRHLQPALDDRSYRHQALMAQDQISRLADGLYPSALRERGLPNTLRDGALAHTLHAAGVAYSCELRGAVSALSSMLRMTIYRIIWDAVTEACLKRDVIGVRVRIRSAEKHGRRAAVVVIHFDVDAGQAGRVVWDEMLADLVRASSGLGLRAIKDRAAIFEGHARARVLPSGRCISVYMFDAIDAGGD